MNFQNIVGEVGSWSVEDRLKLMEVIWDGLLEQGHQPTLTDAQKAELDQRLAEDDEAPDDVVSWTEVKAAASERVDELSTGDSPQGPRGL